MRPFLVILALTAVSLGASFSDNNVSDRAASVRQNSEKIVDHGSGALPGSFSMVWATKAPSPGPGRYWSPGTGVVRDTIWFCGGRVDYGGGNTNSTRTIYAFVPASNTWISSGLPTLLVPRRAGGGARIGNKIYVAGGRDSSHTTLATCEEFDLDTKIVTGKASMPGAGAWACASGVVGSKLYIVGDENNTGSMYEYNVDANAWSTKASLPAGRGWCAGSGAGGKLYVMGGSDAGGATLADCWAYDTATNSWTQKANMPGPRIYHCAVTFDDSIIYVMGGASDGAGYGDSLVYRYHVPGNTWSTETPMPTSRGWLMAAQVRSRVYAAYGSDCYTPTYLLVNEEASFPNHDVTTLSVWPTLKMAPDRSTDFTSLVKNQGLGTETFEVAAMVFDSTAGTYLIDTTRRTVTNLVPGDTQRILWGSLSVASGHVLNYTAWVYLSGDDNPGNDTLRTRIEVRLGSAPDSFGYIYQSTQEEDTLHFGWIDPTGGQQLSGWQPSADDGYVTVSLPFTFPYYGQNLTQLNVCTNGFLETGTTTPYSNTAFPTSVQNHIAGWWEDLDLRTAGTVYQYNDPGGNFVAFAWVDVPRYSGSSELQTFQIVLDREGRIRYNYLDMNGTLNSNTVGIQGGLGTRGWYLQYVYDGQPANHVVADSVSVVFYYPPYLGASEQTTNPAAMRLRIPLSCPTTGLALPECLGDATVGVYSLTGRLLRTSLVAGRDRTVSLRGLPEGVYFVKLSTDRTDETHKLVLVR